MSESHHAVFLSYASQDAEAAKRIGDALRAFGVEVWFDQSELRGGDAWDAKIRRQIHECALFVPVISQHTQARTEGYFRREWKLGVDRTQDLAEDVPFILPVVIDDTSDGHARVPDKFREVQWTRLPGGETPPAFAERVKTLLAGPIMETGRPRPFERDEGVAAPRSDQPRRTPSWPWLAIAAIGIAAAVTVLIWRPWRTPESSAIRSGQPVSEARQLADQAMTILRGANVVRADLEAAEQLFDKAKKLDPTSAEVWAAGAQTDANYIARVYDTSDARKGQARSKAARALKLAPDSFEARLAEAYVLVYAVADPSTWPEAEQLLNSLLNQEPNNKSALIVKGKLLSRQGRDDEAAAYYRRANDPISEGWAYLIAGRVADAEAAADRAITQGISVAGLLLKAAVEAYGREDLNAAQAAIDQLPASELLEDGAAGNAAGIRFMRREPDKVLEIMRAMPRDWLSLFDTGHPKADFTAWAHQLANRPAAAQADWRAALHLVEARLAGQSNYPPLVSLKAYLLACLGERDEGERTLRLYQQLRGQHENEINLDTVEIYFLLGRRDGLIDVLAAALKDPKRDYGLHGYLRYHPMWDPLRGDPRFETLMRETLPKGAKPFDDPKPAAKPAAGNPEASTAPSAPGGPDRKSIAVLPFTNMSEDREANAFFADGMHEDVITNLALIRELRVVSRTTAETYRGTKQSLRQIGDELGVAYILEGSVRRVGNKVRVTGQLIDARTDEHVWAKSYDRDLTDIFAIQSELAQAIAAALQAAISPEEKALVNRRPTENLAAYDLFLKARERRNREGAGPAAVRRQEPLIESAVTLDPNFAVAWADLAFIHGVQYGGYLDHSAARAAKAKTALDHAVRFAPDAPETIRALGDYGCAVLRDNAGAVAQYERLLRLQPNQPLAYWSLGTTYRELGRWREAADNLRRATQLDPASFSYGGDRVALLWGCRRYDDAIAEQRRLVDRGTAANFDWRRTLAMLFFAARGSTNEMEAFLATEQQERGATPRLTGTRKEWSRARGDFPEAIRLDRLQPYYRGAHDDLTLGGEASQACDAALTLAATADVAAARERLGDLPPQVRARLELEPENATFWSVLGLMDAVLGDRKEAQRCANRAVELLPESQSRWSGVLPRCNHAIVLAWTGDKERALAELTVLLETTPLASRLSVHHLKHGPWFWPLRDDPRFQALLDDPKSNAPLF